MEDTTDSSIPAFLLQCEKCRSKRRGSTRCEACCKKVCADCIQVRKKAALLNCNKTINAKDDDETFDALVEEFNDMGTNGEATEKRQLNVQTLLAQSIPAKPEKSKHQKKRKVHKHSHKHSNERAYIDYDSEKETPRDITESVAMNKNDNEDSNRRGSLTCSNKKDKIEECKANAETVVDDQPKSCGIFDHINNKRHSHNSHKNGGRGKETFTLNVEDNDEGSSNNEENYAKKNATKPVQRITSNKSVQTTTAEDEATSSDEASENEAKKPPNSTWFFVPFNSDDQDHDDNNNTSCDSHTNHIERPKPNPKERGKGVACTVTCKSCSGETEEDKDIDTVRTIHTCQKRRETKKGHKKNNKSQSKHAQGTEHSAPRKPKASERKIVKENVKCNGEKEGNGRECEHCKTPLGNRHIDQRRPSVSALHFNISNSKPVTTKHKVIKAENNNEKETICIKTEKDAHNCDISGMAMLSGNELVVADKNNSKLKIVDLETRQITLEILFVGSSRSVTVVPPRTIAVTLPERHLVKLVTLDKHTVNEERDLDCDGFCFGIAYCKGRLIVSFVDPASVKVINLRGEVIANYDDRNLKFDRPQYLSVCKDEERFLASDASNHSVYKINLDGSVSCVYTFRGKWFPLSVQAIAENTFIVCSSTCSTISVVTDDVTASVLAEEDLHVVHRPKIVCFCSKTRRLYVSSAKYKISGTDCNYIQMFRL